MLSAEISPKIVNVSLDSLILVSSTAQHAIQLVKPAIMDHPVHPAQLKLLET
jgi:hypothetical protein